MIKVSDYIARFLEQQGVTHVYELIGGMITHMIDSIHRAGRVRIVSLHHEQGAAFAADAMGRITGIPGVAMATSGPGAVNLLTGIGSCYFDSAPAVWEESFSTWFGAMRVARNAGANPNRTPIRRPRSFLRGK